MGRLGTSTGEALDNNTSELNGEPVRLPALAHVYLEICRSINNARDMGIYPDTYLLPSARLVTNPVHGGYTFDTREYNSGSNGTTVREVLMPIGGANKGVRQV